MDQVTALRFQTGERRQTAPPPFGVKRDRETDREIDRLDRKRHNHPVHRRPNNPHYRIRLPRPSSSSSPSPYRIDKPSYIQEQFPKSDVINMHTTQKQVKLIALLCSAKTSHKPPFFCLSSSSSSAAAAAVAAASSSSSSSAQRFHSERVCSV